MPPPDLLTWSEAGIETAAAIAALAAVAFDPLFREAWRESQIADLLASGQGWLLVGRDGEGLAAFALCRRAADEAELLLFAIRPDRRRQGIGRAMLENVLEAGRERGARRIFLEVRATNEAALSLYRSFGFRQTGLRQGYYRTTTGVSIDAVTLSFDLTCASSAGSNPDIGHNLAHSVYR
jgi:ribosomal-protein-alanine N-acetyltransferase